MEVVEVDLRDAYAFGGGFIVVLLMYIERENEDYFPNQKLKNY